MLNVRKFISRHLAFVLYTGCVVSLSGLANAADAPVEVSKAAEAEAKVHREKGLDHFKKKEYAQAIEAFQKALALQRTAGAMAQMASALNAIGRYDEALRWYETVLAEFPKASTGLRLKVNAELTDLVAKVGTIAVEGDVIKDSRLFVDSRDVGALPLEAPVRVLAGVHEVRAEKPGFAPIKASVEVSAGKPSVAKLVAPKREGKLDIKEKHNWRLHIEIDGKDFGLSPQLIPIEIGEHRVRLRGFMGPDALLACETPEQAVDTGARMESEEKPVTVELYETQSVELSAEDMDASLRVESTPKGATLRIDGRDMGQTNWEGRLPLGEHSIELSLGGFEIGKQRVTLERRKQQQIGMLLQRIPEPPGFWTGRTVGATAAFGVGLLGIGVFGVTGGLALQASSDLQAACVNGTCSGSKADEIERARTLGNAALAGLVVGGIGVVTGSVVLIAAKPKAKGVDKAPVGLSVGAGLSGLVMKGAF